MPVHKIATAGLEKHEKVMLQAAVETASGMSAALWQCCDQAQQAEVIFLDPQTDEGKILIREYADQANVPILVYCTAGQIKNNRPDSARFSIKPPITYSKVLPVLRLAEPVIREAFKNPYPRKELVSALKKTSEHILASQAESSTVKAQAEKDGESKESRRPEADPVFPSHKPWIEVYSKKSIEDEESKESRRLETTPGFPNHALRIDADSIKSIEDGESKESRSPETTSVFPNHEARVEENSIQLTEDEESMESPRPETTSVFPNHEARVEENSIQLAEDEESMESRRPETTPVFPNHEPRFEEDSIQLAEDEESMESRRPETTPVFPNHEPRVEENSIQLAEDEESMESRRPETTPVFPNHEPRVEENSIKPIDGQFHQLLDRIINEGKSVEITHPDFPPIRICTERQWYTYSRDPGKSGDLFRTNASEFSVVEKGDQIRKEAFSGSFPKPLWGLVFSANLFATGNNPDKHYFEEDFLYLVTIPDFDKLPHTREHVRVAEYISHVSAPVNKISADTEVNRSIVTSFCRACQAIDLLIVAGQEPNNLYNLINTVISRNVPVEINHPEFPPIKICPEKKWFVFSGDLARYPGLFECDASEFTITDKGDEIRKNAFDGGFPRALWCLLYTASLFAAKNRLLLPLKPEYELMLSEMPDLTTIPEIEKYKTLTEYMLLNPATIQTIAVATKFGIPTIIAFCNACQAIGLLKYIPIEISPPTGLELDITIESERSRTEAPRRKGLLKKFLSNEKNYWE